MKIQLVSVEITTGNSMHKLHRDVKAYEVPLIQVAHGDDNVRIVGPNGTIDIETNPAEEYDRLIQLYARRDGELVRRVYRHPGELAEGMELARVDDFVSGDEPEADEPEVDEQGEEVPVRKKPGRKPASQK